jgi:hypothetical protein
MNPSKMPKKKEITRTDNPDKVAMYKEGGLAKQAATAIAMKEAGKKPKKMAAGGELKEVPEDNTGLSKLPTEVRNKMGYMKDGGKTKSKVNEAGKKPKKMGAGGETKDELKPYIQGQVNTDKYGTGGGGRAGFSRSVGKDADISAYIEGGGFKPKGGEFKGKVTGGGVTYTKKFDKGGETKSKVNEAGNYTKPELRKRIFNSVKAAAIVGTGAGQWSARKAQVMAKRYKAAGGGYRD